MTYGENTTAMRDHLATLLRQHRIQQRLGGGGTHTLPVTTTEDQRRDLGDQIQRYRHGVATWCLEAVTAAGTSTDRNDPVAHGDTEELRHRLTNTLEAKPVRLPTLAELTTRQDFPLLETWRQAARAAALGEHDFGPSGGRGCLSASESNTVTKDAGDLVRALIVLDNRYANIPGWRPLRKQTSLEQAATACSLSQRDTEPSIHSGRGSGLYDGAVAPASYSVDDRGWRPAPAFIEGPSRPGLAGVLQAQHNTLFALTEFPSALNLRRVLHAQAAVSHQAARHASRTAPDLVAGLTERQQTYQAMLRECRDLGGLLGNGATAAAEAANAVTRLQRLRPGDSVTAQPLHDLNRLLTRTDARIATTVEHGLSDRLYFLSVQASSTFEEAPLDATEVRQQWVAVTSPLQTDLLKVVRDRLRPPAPLPAAHANNTRSRDALTEALTHRFARRHPTP